jgi:uncharacterized membrane protein YfcA
MIAQLSNPWWAFVLLGICAGVLGGALGLGSGTILVPALVLLYGFGQKSAQGMALAIMVPMALIGALQYWRNPEIELNAAVIGLAICGAVFGALAGAELAARLPSNILRKTFAVVLVIVAVRMFTTPSRPRESGRDNGATLQKMANLVERGGPDNNPGK